MGRRIGWLGIFITLCFVALFVQLNNVQVVQAKAEADNPHNPRIVFQKYAQPKGLIEAADGTVLAKSVPTHANTIYKYTRTYPQGGLYSQIVGYDSLIYGSSGVEASYVSYLKTHNAPVKTIRDLLSTHTITDTVRLTVQPKLQQAGRTALAGRVGGVVALDPATGAVLAMYANPTFNPNPLTSLNPKTEAAAWKSYTSPDPAQHGFTPLLPISYADSFPPGSTFKIVTTSAVYQHKPSLIHKSYPSLGCLPPALGPYGQPHGINLPDTTQGLCNYGNHFPNAQTVAGTCGGTIRVMLPPSCDTGYALIGLDLGPQNLYQEAYSYGFDQQPPIDLPHSYLEVSRFPTVAQLQANVPFQAYSAIGQGNVAATPLQMALVAATVANHGVMMTPHVMADIYDSQGNLVTRYKPTPWKTPISPSAASAIKNLMTHVVSNTDGTAYGIFNPADDVGAKTGTAQIGVGNTGTTDWMIALAPASAPKIALAVVMPDEAPSATGAAVAGPVIRAMLQAVLGQ